MSFTNKLIAETSPYLLQHAHNPVNWYPWGEEALKRARQENKPILVSIGYAACHWCHVMERESFEDEATAALMNEHFINIKIDREERPDLDHIYMDAVQAMTGSGGWPLNVFLTPDTKPFYGGTYFPPKPAYNRPSWQDVLYNISNAYREKQHELEAQAENLTEHLRQANSFGLQNPGSVLPGEEMLDEMAANCLSTADTDWGGFGKAPKFPQTFTIDYLLRYYYIKKVRGNEDELAEASLKQALLSLDKMIDGGIYDHAGGGFARYSTDTEWLAPHFEKMLYDNALLVIVLSDAYLLTKKVRYREVIEQTMEFINRELLHHTKGFYAALDADSEGVEGKFYVWDLQEVENLLGEDASIFCDYYNITKAGNWESKNILRVLKPFDIWLTETGLDEKKAAAILESGRKKLLEARGGRIRPQLDDKIILGWNALMNSACSRAFCATGNETYRQLALDNMHFLLDNLSADQGFDLWHTWKNGQAKYPAFLDDYAFLIQALLHLQEITADPQWLEKARGFTEFVITHYSEESAAFFYYTREGQADIIVRKKEVYDGAVPSGNAIMAQNLKKLGIYLEKADWEERSLFMVRSLEKAIIKYPGSFGCWASLLLFQIKGADEIVIIGESYPEGLYDILSVYIPNRIIQAAPAANPDYPLLRDRESAGKTLFYLCRNYGCQSPVLSANLLISLINSP